MSTNAVVAQGLLLKRGDGGSPEVFTTVNQVHKIAGPSVKLDTVDVTDFNSAGSKQFKATLLDPGTVTFEIFYDPKDAQQAALRSDLLAKTLRNFQLAYPDTGLTVCSFAAIVEQITTDADTPGVLTASVALKISGAPTWA